MTGQPAEQEKKTSSVIGFLVKRLWLVAVACFALSALAACLLFVRRGADSGTLLRAIDAAHSVPDQENAAGIYTRLIEDTNLPSLDPSLLPQKPAMMATGRAWRDAEFPQVAAWIKERQKILDLLLEAGRKPQCWFPVSAPRVQVGNRTQTVMRCHELLVRAAQNDLGEGRVDAGLEKMLCMLRQARHFYSQSNPSDYFTGVSIAYVGLKAFPRLVVIEDVSSEWLAQFEAALPPIEGPLTEQLQRVEEVSRLQLQEMQRGVLAQFLSLFISGKPPRNDDFNTAYAADCRVARILVALRRYRNQAGQWPASLEEIQNEIPPVALRDPLSGKSFVYRPEGGRFVLYSVGTDGTDDGGRYPGDHPFYPP